MDQLLDRILTEKDLNAVCKKFPKKNWEVVFIHDFQFTAAELEHAEYDNPGNGFKGVILSLLIIWRDRKTRKRKELFEILQGAYRRHLFTSEWYLDVFESIDGARPCGATENGGVDIKHSEKNVPESVSALLKEWYGSASWLHHRLIHWPEDNPKVVQAFLTDVDVSIVDSGLNVMNSTFAVEPNGSKCSSNGSGSSSNKSFSSLYETFLGEGINRILAVGDMGMGKTLLSKKISMDWTSDKLPRSFRCVFVVELGEMKPKQSVADAILDQCPYLKDEKVSCGLVEELLQDTSTLLILDGYDELRETQEVDDIVSRRKYRNSCLILTSKPHSASKLESFVQIKVTLDGFSRDNLFRFVSHQLGSSDDAEKFEDFIADNQLDGLVGVPLFALLLCQVYKHRKTTPLPVQKKTMFDVFMSTLKIYRPMCHFSVEEIARAKEVLSELACKALLSQNKTVLCKSTALQDVKPLSRLIRHNKRTQSATFTSDVSFTHEAFKYYFAAMGIAEKRTINTLDKVLDAQMNSLERFLDAGLFFSLLFGFGNPQANATVLQHLGQLYHSRSYGISSASMFMVDSRVYFDDDSGCEDHTTDLNEIAIRLVSLDTKQHENDLCSILPLCHNLYKECENRQHTFSSRPLCNAALYIVDFEAEADPADLPALSIDFIPRNVVFRNFRSDNTIEFPEINLVKHSDSSPYTWKSSLRVLDSDWNSTFCRDLSSWVRRYSIELDHVALTGLTVNVEPDVEKGSSMPYSQCTQKLATALIQPGLTQLALAAVDFKPVLWRDITQRLQGCHNLKHLHVCFVDITSHSTHQLASCVRHMAGLQSFAFVLDFTDKNLAEWKEPCTEIVAALQAVTSMNKLSLKINFTEEAIHLLADKLSSWKRTLHSLCLISDQQVSFSCSTLIQAVSQCRMLENLCLIQMDIGGNLHQLLRRPSDIKNLVLMKCQLTDVDAKHIALVLTSCKLPLLVHLDVRHNNIADTEVVTNAVSTNFTDILLLCHPQASKEMDMSVSESEERREELMDEAMFLDSGEIASSDSFNMVHVSPSYSELESFDRLVIQPQATSSPYVRNNATMDVSTSSMDTGIESGVVSEEDLVRCNKCTMYMNLRTDDEKLWGKCRVCKSYIHERCMNRIEKRDFTKHKLICFECISMNESFV